ncbi:serine/threonine-protein kinase [Nonomuraea sp. NPDC050790]|uniref:serine/threonine-protein kinase n=1 Tax=Nonomuraea sp. NPDC050790 TaxID=3364371 RepID=UPI0037A8208F
MPHPHPARPSAGIWAAFVGWAILPFVSCGLATPLTIGFAAYWLRSTFTAIAAVVYTVFVGSFLITIVGYEEFDHIPEPMRSLITIGFGISWLGGVIHSGILVPFMAKARIKSPTDLHQRVTTPTYHPPPGNTGFHRQSGQPAWIGPYRVLHQLGRGGQGAVYLATAPDGNRVAVKVLHDLVDETARARFAREVDSARRVATFSTARLLDVNITGQHAYIVSEYVEGPSLEQLVKKHGPRDQDSLVRLALSTAGALAAIHKAGVVHRDFKPSNVLIGPDGPRVIDFGIARALDQVTVTQGKMVGTPPYMSPEQLTGEAVGPASDVFSWAVTMIFAATGRPAFGEDTVPAVFNRVLTVHPDLSPLPPGLRGIIGSCLNKSPAERPSASDVMLAIVH